MLSYKAIIAIQLLQLILNAGEKGLTITEQKNLAGLQGTTVSRTALLLKKGGWLRIDSFYRYRTTEMAKEASLCDMIQVKRGTLSLNSTS